jgi:hypothetical protein
MGMSRKEGGIGGTKTGLDGVGRGTVVKWVAAGGTGSVTGGGVRSGEGGVGETGSGSGVTDMTAADDGIMPRSNVMEV